MIERRFKKLLSMQLHFREARPDAATSLILLHPTPKSSAMFEPFMARLAGDFHVVAVDTPGYGLSDPLPTPANSIADYLPVLRELFHDTSGKRFMLYGSATGAQLAAAYAHRYPDDVIHLFLDNAAHFDDLERTALLANYFIDLNPRPDGSHLAGAWAMSRQFLQYFPWYATDAAHRYRPSEPSADEIQAVAMEFLSAGPRYAEAYRAAFDHERIENYQRLNIPTTLFRWQGSILLKHIDRLLAFDLPPNITAVDVPAPMDQRYELMLQTMRGAIHQ